MEVDGTRVAASRGRRAARSRSTSTACASSEGVDFVRRDGELVFSRELAHEGRLGFWRWLSLFLGVAGTYRKHESVDVVYEVDGRRIVESGLPILGSEPIEAGR